MVDLEMNREINMKNLLRHTLLFVMSVAMVGTTACTSMETIHASEGALTEMKIRPGDKLTLHYTNGAAERIRLTGFDEQEISGIADDGRSVAANYEQVISIDHKEVEALKTAGAAVGVVALGAIVIAGAALGTAVMVAGGI